MLRSFQRALEIRGSLKRQQWQKLLDEYSGATHTNTLPEFCGVIIYWVRKKLARF